MADHAEEQEMEAEAMSAIFDSHFEILEPSKWRVTIYPESGGPSELDALNHVGCRLLVTLPETYPEDPPELDIEIVKGLAEEQRQELKDLADDEAAANEGVPSMFAVTERLREWLLENNVKGLDDVSMHAQMMRKRQQEEKAQVRVASIPICMLNTLRSVHTQRVGRVLSSFASRNRTSVRRFTEGAILFCIALALASISFSARTEPAWSRSHLLYRPGATSPSRQC